MGGLGARHRNSDHPRPQECLQHNARVGSGWQNTIRNPARPRAPPPPVLGDIAVAPVALAAEADELLCDLLLALPDDAWSALAAAVSGELAEQLRRYLGEG